MRSYRHGPLTYRAEPILPSSTSAKSPLLHTPMAGTVTGGSGTGGWTSDSGVRIARYSERLAVSAAGSASRSTTGSMAGCADHSRRLRKPSSDSHRSATPANWNSSMYQDFSRWRQPADRNEAGWPTDSAVIEATRPGISAAVHQATAAPQS